ncbi:MAG TPA: chloride channel protein, partial [Armatimonadota bacterium]|nr:chloride channel protein [Armatimonadota bacterium]
TFLKPLSAAVAIGTGGPFGAEGPIIATGGALGSLIGQVLQTTAVERKTLLAAGAAAGMAATFGSPVSAVILAVELLLFEFRPRSIIPVALASATATGVRYAFAGSGAVFPMSNVHSPGGAALTFYIALGALVGVAAVGVTRLVYGIEDAFEKLPVHWMWWPALGGLVVGIVGYFAPRTLGVGYDNIEHLVDGTLTGQVVLFLCVMKLASWSISLGSGTSGGTLAPLFTIGGALGAVIGGATAAWLPELGIDPRVAALVGMAAIFSGASRALLASIVFAFETTLQPMGLLPLLGGCTAAYLVSCLLMRHTIMTEKIARRGIRVPAEYAADYLEQVLVRSAASAPVVTLQAGDTLEKTRAWLAQRGPGTRHQGYPVLDKAGRLMGVVTRRDLMDPAHPGDRRIQELIRRPPVVAFEDNSLREAADHMVHEGVGRLPVVSPERPDHVIGIITRSDLLAAHKRRLQEASHARRHIRIRRSLMQRLRRNGHALK